MLSFFADEFKNLRSKEELEEEKHNQITTDTESPNRNANGKQIRHLKQWLVMEPPEVPVV